MLLTASIHDLSSWVVAVGTLALAGATFYMARRTSAMADETRKLAKETREGIDSSAAQFRQERMPVVMPLGEMRDIASGRVPETLPWARFIGEDKQESRVFVPIENVGAGPAIDISASLYWLDQYGARSVSSTQPMVTRSGVLPALGASQRATLAFEFRGLAITPMMAFRLTLEYGDGAGGEYKVTADFYPGTKSYGKMAFEPPEELRLPSSWPKPVPLPDPPPRNRSAPRESSDEAETDDLIGLGDSKGSECQWPSSSPHWRPSFLPIEMAMFSPHWWPRSSPPAGECRLGQGLDSLPGGRLRQAVAVGAVGNCLAVGSGDELSA